VTRPSCVSRHDIHRKILFERTRIAQGSGACNTSWRDLFVAPDVYRVPLGPAPPGERRPYNAGRRIGSGTPVFEARRRRLVESDSRSRTFVAADSGRSFVGSAASPDPGRRCHTSRDSERFRRVRGVDQRPAQAGGRTVLWPGRAIGIAVAGSLSRRPH
jgi:hypothetical protein